MDAADPRRQRLAGLDGLRGLAALYVVVNHVFLRAFPGYPVDHAPFWAGWFIYGRFAVVVFIVLSGFSLALGPVLGGTLVEAWSWRGIFWFDVTFGLAALVVAAMVLPESSDPRAGRVDVTGTALGACALAALVFAVISGETAGFTAAWILVLFGVSAVAAAAFGVWEFRTPHPLLDPHFLRVPRFVTPNVIAACCYFATFAIFFFTALYLGEVAGYSGYRIAAMFAPMTSAQSSRSMS